jgi:hypothetical protein
MKGLTDTMRKEKEDMRKWVRFEKATNRSSRNKPIINKIRNSTQRLKIGLDTVEEGNAKIQADFIKAG